MITRDQYATAHAGQHSTGEDERKPLGALLVESGAINAEQLDEALKAQNERGHGSLLGEVLVELGFASDQTVMKHLARAYGVPYARITPRLADPRIGDVLPRDFVETHCVLPLFKVGNHLTIAVAEPANLFLVEEIERITDLKVQIVASTASDIRATIQAYLPSANVFVIDDIYDDVDIREFRSSDKQAFDLGAIEQMSGQSPVVKLVNYVLYQAITERASDVHIEAHDHVCRVRFRVDGRLVTKLMPPYQMHPAVVSRVKIMAGMDIAERRIPQDGDMHVAVEGRPVDLRISTMPGKFGEKVVIRIIDNRNAIIAVEKLGMRPELTVRWRQIISEPNGMVLVTGPTGSGKSTTLYSAIAEIASEEINVSTVENPVEAQLPGINQFQVNEKAGFTFATALRALLRQDPDVLMVGEIRDLETATIATQAALTGHLVLSTLHTNDAVSAITRMVNMGIEPYLVAAMLRGVLAQRLVRKICPHCKGPTEPIESVRTMVAEVLGKEPKFFEGKGCGRCHGSGYAGRLGIHELLIPEEGLMEVIAHGASLQELREEADRTGHQGLSHDGFFKASAGLTTIDEVLRVSAL
ncbi:MAG: Flp pilus assembly complex ATPase component TadA [Phycisphaerales bacterium]|nr:Flp pilus assembly complex ATPase component TadA [Phycisphaerales bacterium]